jgi:hypothetical protein
VGTTGFASVSKDQRVNHCKRVQIMSTDRDPFHRRFDRSAALAEPVAPLRDNGRGNVGAHGFGAHGERETSGTLCGTTCDQVVAANKSYLALASGAHLERTIGRTALSSIRDALK